MRKKEPSFKRTTKWEKEEKKENKQEPFIVGANYFNAIMLWIIFFMIVFGFIKI